jgi:hypothetical protein
MNGHRGRVMRPKSESRGGGGGNDDDDNDDDEDDGDEMSIALSGATPEPQHAEVSAPPPSPRLPTGSAGDKTTMRMHYLL